MGVDPPPGYLKLSVLLNGPRTRTVCGDQDAAGGALGIRSKPATRFG